jgi:hypothetical protein
MPSHMEYKLLTITAHRSMLGNEAGSWESHGITAALNHFGREGWTVKYVIATPFETTRSETEPSSTGSSSGVETMLYSIFLEREVRTTRTPRH